MRNAYIGYTYQKHVTFLILTKMDVERNIELIEIEADVDNKFDDIKIISDTNEYYFQIKDIDNISIENLNVSNDSININGKPHKLSKNINILFFKNINITPNCEVLGFAAYKLVDVYIVSFNRVEINTKINELYNYNLQRESVLKNYFSDCLDKRKLTIQRKDLPTINVFSTELLEPTINIGKKHLEVDNILVIEGKPGVGKRIYK